MNISRKTRLAPPSGLQNGCGPHTSSAKSPTTSNFTSAAGKSFGKSNDKSGDSDNLPREHTQSQVLEMFEKCFCYQKFSMLDDWRLPTAENIFAEYYQLESFQELKVKLNQVKSKLNDYDIELWSAHTRRQDPAGEIPWRLKSETDAEFVTIAWCKMYECLGRFPELIPGPKINSLHLCEAPGAFITALNHYLYTTYEKTEVQWNWLATTLNPYYEGNPVNKMIMDDRFLLYTLENWLFHKDFTGNIINTENLEHMKQQCKQRLGDIHLITADGSIDCTDAPDFQEEKVALLHYAEIITALSILADGGSFVIKMFTMFEASSICKLYLLNCVFKKVYVFKPCTSKRGNSEVYVVCMNYNKNTKNLHELIEKLKMKLNLQNAMLWPLFAKSLLPRDYLRQHEICCRMFMNYQITAIEQNIYTFEIRPHKVVTKRLQSLRTAVCDEFYRRYNIQKVPNDLKILYKYRKNVERKHKNQLIKGSHSEREMSKDTAKDEKIFKLRKHLNELEKMFKENLTLNEIQLQFDAKTEENDIKLLLYRGKSVFYLNSSLFTDVHILVMRNKLNDLYELKPKRNDCLWLRQPRLEFGEGTTQMLINFEDSSQTLENFSTQQEHFFKSVISNLLKYKPNKIKFVNMPFLTHYAVSLLRYLSCLTYTNLTFTMYDHFEIVLSAHSKDFILSLEELQAALLSSLDQDIFCFLNISLLHSNDFSKTLSVYNNMLLLQNYKYLLYN